MACSGTGGCESGCYKDENESTNRVLPSVTNKPLSNLCLKCKSSEIIAGAVNGGNNMKLCGECFRGNLYGKFKLAVTANAMISPSDNVLVAFSGGTSSRYLSCSILFFRSFLLIILLLRNTFVCI